MYTFVVSENINIYSFFFASRMTTQYNQVHQATPAAISPPFLGVPLCRVEKSINVCPLSCICQRTLVIETEMKLIEWMPSFLTKELPIV